MKIGTDGVLLGAWASLKNKPSSILDIGTGTGILALQLAQRSESELIDAIEIDTNAYEQAVENFENSDWANRLFCYHASLEDFTEEMDETYDLIVSNPPFYTDTFESENSERNKARFTSSLSFETLLKAISKLLSKDGEFSVIIPFKEREKFMSMAKKVNLVPKRICNVKGMPKSQFKRCLIEFRFHASKLITSELVIETSRHEYTQAYQKLVKDFYLKM
jgi:tRNA1Val (adenine37-N6)-methyltransferase